MKLFKDFITFAFLGTTSEERYHKDLLRWAKTEYSKDWQWAYNYMIENPGKAPTHSSGVTL